MVVSYPADMKNKYWRKELRKLIAEAMVTPLNDLNVNANAEDATDNMITARNKIIRFVEKLLES